MKPLLIVLFILSVCFVDAQSYVDSGIQHFSKGEYDEALDDFVEAIKLESMFTESSKAKIYYYRGMIWLDKAEKLKGEFVEQSPIISTYEDISKVTQMDESWKEAVNEAFTRLGEVAMDEADRLAKLEKKADEVVEKTNLLDQRIKYLELVEKLEASSFINLYLGQTNQQAGDVIFENTTDILMMQKAKAYYEEAVKYFELARYDDPFSKDIIEALLTISKRLGDVDRIDEYEGLLKLASG